MAYRGLKIASLAVVAALALVAAAAAARLPAGARLPVHWNAAGEVDGWDDARAALFFPVALTAAVGLVMAMVPRVEPLQRQLAQSAPLFRTGWAAALALAALVEAVIAAPAFHVALPAMLPLAGAGLALLAIGNVLPKSRPGFFVGIRTPWTLTDPENWIATHRFGARTTMAAGALMTIAALAPAGARPALIGAAGSLCLGPLPYSWWRWHRAAADGKRRPG